ncbi:Uncharacterised protein [Serratia plymuthica]|uniref:DUF7916 domain-containing protein n=1 Tax=Serratia plymuthica TaxID=82996 RepID=A0A2X4U454_SERPL|nr:Uncharacterised protein [Serratia plymuthica]
MTWGDKLVLVTGKMHGAGIVRESGSQLINERDIALFVENGADIVLLPAPGTIPGMSQEKVAALIAFTQQQGALAMTAIGTSQEGADVQTLRQIALMSKMAGADLHHIGDTGYLGLRCRKTSSPTAWRFAACATLIPAWLARLTASR